ncbi:hypothetical protein SKAU_G00429220 [Synaphobranchus kaupii]|uniref:Uncharacterized protein n=1 Tax=Synaphobranchus kaupii TaxID=118154 RepID=A0A9Q1E4G7_SYNKA|nr:hypothetical protein SKAU_G00429220 [Synaphobranchus kaupii]
MVKLHLSLLRFQGLGLKTVSQLNPDLVTIASQGVMEATVLASSLSGILLFVSVVFLIGLCSGCRRTAHRTTIPEHFTDDYIPQDHNPQGFRVVRPACPISCRSSGNSVHLPFPSPMFTTNHRASYVLPPTDGGSIPSYENPGSQDGDYINENPDSDEEENEKGEGYIEVLPDPPAVVSVCRSQQSLVSTQSSDRGNYVNVIEEDYRSDTSSQNYINVEAEGGHYRLSPGISIDNVDSDNNSNSDYVNTSEFININNTTFQ